MSMDNLYRVEQWSIFEVAFDAHVEGNPFTDVRVVAMFWNENQSIEVEGFYDGNGIYRLRFMPVAQGMWQYETHSSHEALDGKTGSFFVTPPTASNHGPVGVRERFNFAYADGSQYFQAGTTCYAWVHQSETLQQETLRTLASAPFNKVRMCILPKWYPYNRVEPSMYPYEGEPPQQWDFTRFNPAFFQHLDRCIGQLRDLGVEADLILFHPYDEEQWVVEKPSVGPHWGFDRMGQENDDRYLRYVVARYSAFRNVWWSLANEWDFVKTKCDADWHRFGEIIQETDPYDHLTSIHNGHHIFDQSKPWISHVSLQSDRLWEAREIRERYCKPVIYDECCYEGTIEQGWGNITAERMVANFWTATIGGAYCGHGETYFDPNDEIWWSKGGALRGQSPARIAFLMQIVGQAPIDAQPLNQHVCWGVEGDYYLVYLGERQPERQHVELPQGSFTAELIDTWNMTVDTIPGRFSGKTEFHLPGRAYMALRFVRAK